MFPLCKGVLLLIGVFQAALSAEVTSLKQATFLRRSHATFLRRSQLAAVHDNATDGLRKGADQDDDDEDDDDDDDEGSEDEASAKSNRTAAPQIKVPVRSQSRSQKLASSHVNLALPQAKPADSDTARSLADNRAKQQKLLKKLGRISDPGYNQEIEVSKMLVAKQTQSKATAAMLAQMWKEMRIFNVPGYTERMEDKLLNLKDEETKLKDPIAAAHLGTAKETDEEKERRAEGNQWLQRRALRRDVDKNHAAKQGKLTWTEMLKAKKEQLTHWFWNSWLVSQHNKVPFLVSSIVYLFAGIFLAYLHNKARDRDAAIFQSAPQLHIKRTRNNFSFSIFGCVGAANVCIVGCCCPCLRWADTMDRHGFLTYWRAFLAFFILALLSIYTYGGSAVFLVFLGVHYRQRLRKLYEIEHGTWPSIFFDFVAWSCCQPCAIIQEAREESALPAEGPEAATHVQ